MNLSSIKGLVARQGTKLGKHSPLILTVVGIGGLVTAGVIAAKQSTKLEAVVDQNNAELEEAKQSEDSSFVRKTVVTNVTRVAKLYVAPVTLSVASVALILSGHQILSRRNAALAVAYQGLQSAFSAYRDRVIEEYGSEVDERIRHNVSKVVSLDEKGKEVTQDLTVKDDAYYLFDFGPGNVNWVPNVEHNLFFLQSHQTVFNDMLRARRSVFLSEVLDALGIPRTPASIVTGWVYNKENPNGDNRIDFGINNKWTEQGYITLDFNTDGVIYDLI